MLQETYNAIQKFQKSKKMYIYNTKDKQNSKSSEKWIL